MKQILYLILITVMSAFSGCTGVKETYNLKNCDYDFHSITNLTISDIDLSKGLTPLMIPVVLSILSGNSTTAPMHFVVNIDVKNPNEDAASFEKLEYIIYIDDVRITDGLVTQPFYVEGGNTKILSVDIDVDIMDLVKDNTWPVTENAIKNFLGISDTPSKVTVQLKPSFKVGKQTFAAPSYVSVNFTYNGK